MLGSIFSFANSELKELLVSGAGASVQKHWQALFMILDWKTKILFESDNAFNLLENDKLTLAPLIVFPSIMV